ncbi:MAG: tRNA 4-thiouridine(8) synthase ThiI [Firmicutes bacterium]|nr:tRNA 4-thiouridine(8) synthase ThiI [Bacillota bacterium]
MKKLIIARYGEIHLKGGNREFFLNRLLKNLRQRLGKGIKVEHFNTRIEISNYDGYDEQEILQKVRDTFGVFSTNIVDVIESTKDAIFECIAKIKVNESFKVNVNRADKKFEIKSPEFAAMCGGIILDNNKDAVVDVQNPSVTINVDIRIGGRAYVYVDDTNDNSKGAGGLPVGVSGRALVLLSGGIDSPVAACLAAKRGLTVDFIHFATPPYTNDLALKKIEKLKGILEGHVGKTHLFVVPFTEISREIQKKCDDEYMITIMRRFMVRIAERVGLQLSKSDCIITGENLAQVASQTIQGIASNNFCATQLPILRPLITFDKSEIITMAKRIGTYNTSIEPHMDCCTVFVPNRPSIKPDISKVEEQEKRLDIERLVEESVKGITC